MCIMIGRDGKYVKAEYCNYSCAKSTASWCSSTIIITIMIQVISLIYSLENQVASHTSPPYIYYSIDPVS